MSGSPYRPRPNNGSGDSPRPPFLTEFVNHIGERWLVEAIYHLIGRQLALRIHPHIERALGLEAEPPLRFCKLQRAQAQIGEQAVSPAALHAVANLGERAVQQRDLG